MGNTKIQSAIQSLLDEWAYDDPQHINEGECMVFIDELFLMDELENTDIKRMSSNELPDTMFEMENGYAEPYHVWITDGEYHYDAECPAWSCELGRFTVF